MIDKAHIETEKILLQLERKIKRFYNRESREIASKAEYYFAGYYSLLYEMETLLEDGVISEDQFEEWLMSQSIDRTNRNNASKLARDVVEMDVNALEIINGALVGIWVLNRQQEQKITKDIAIKMGMTYREISPEELAKIYERAISATGKLSNPFKVNIDKTKDLAWTDKHFQAAIQYGIREGYGTKKMEKYIMQAMIPNYHSCVRYARTYVTAVENDGRLSEARRLVDEGWTVTKEWVATADHRTRSSHLEIWGEEREIEDTFSNDLMFPGDRSSNKPEEFINCRCYMRINRQELPDVWPDYQ